MDDFSSDTTMMAEDAYAEGYDDGMDEGYREGERDGYEEGYADAMSDPEAGRRAFLRLLASEGVNPLDGTFVRWDAAEKRLRVERGEG